MEVHWRIIANLGFKFRSYFTAHCASSSMAVVLLAVLLAGGSSRAMLASARSLVEIAQQTGRHDVYNTLPLYC